MSFHNMNSLWGGVTVLTAGLARQVPGVCGLLVVALGKGGPCRSTKWLCQENTGLRAMDV